MEPHRLLVHNQLHEHRIDCDAGPALDNAMYPIIQLDDPARIVMTSGLSYTFTPPTVAHMAASQQLNAPCMQEWRPHIKRTSGTGKLTCRCSDSSGPSAGSARCQIRRDGFADHTAQQDPTFRAEHAVLLGLLSSITDQWTRRLVPSARKAVG